LRWRCSVCGEEHEGLPLDWAAPQPAYWDGGRNDDDWLTSDLCTWTDDAGERAYFIRGVLHVPVRELDDALRFGVWASLSERSFEQVLELWDDPGRANVPPYFGWLSNWIAGYPDTRNLPSDVVMTEPDLRPSIELHEGDHPLVREQQQGISMDRLLELIGQRLHDGES
jgi:hypothetical protein